MMMFILFYHLSLTIPSDLPLMLSLFIILLDYYAITYLTQTMRTVIVYNVVVLWIVSYIQTVISNITNKTLSVL